MHCTVDLQLYYWPCTYGCTWSQYCTWSQMQVGLAAVLAQQMLWLCLAAAATAAGGTTGSGNCGAEEKSTLSLLSRALRGPARTPGFDCRNGAEWNVSLRPGVSSTGAM